MKLSSVWDFFNDCSQDISMELELVDKYSTLACDLIKYRIDNNLSIYEFSLIANVDYENVLLLETGEFDIHNQDLLYDFEIIKDFIARPIDK